MKIFIDINHPAHVHYFRHLITDLSSKGYSFVVTNRDEKIINQLLDHFGIQHHIRGRRPINRSRVKSITYLFSMILDVFKVARKTKPDLFLGFASPACSINGFLFRKPSVILDDTEHNKINHFIYKPFCSVILTPHFFSKNMGNKHIRFCAYIEQLYLHSKYFSPKKILSDNNYALVRYISFGASHDRGVQGVATNSDKIELIEKLSRKMKVYISSESMIPDDSMFKEFELRIDPSNMHSVIAKASLFISEGATMASEAGVLGTPYYYINPLSAGNVIDQEKHYKHAHSCHINDVIKQIDSVVEEKDEQIVGQIENSTINPTEFLIYFIQNYPRSVKKIGDRIVDKKVFEDIVR